MEIGRILKYYRTLYGLTQTEVAEMAGINEKYYGRLERNESVPTIDKVEKLCRAFDLRMIDLLAAQPGSMSDAGEDAEDRQAERTVFYCNCCGTTFDRAGQTAILCPNCECEYDESNEYIEEVTI